MSKDAITINLPVGQPAKGYHRQHLNLQLSELEAQTLAAIMSGLAAGNQVLAPGVPGAAERHVQPGNGADAIRWILQQARQQMLAQAWS